MLGGDLAAGATVAAISVPAALAYAQVAGLPPVMGLYAAVLPLAVFALFSSCRVLVVGPDASLSAVVAAALVAVTGGDPARAAELAPMLGLLVGITFAIMGLARLGFLANFLSRPMLAGFMAGLAVVILVGQIPAMLGIPASDSSTSLGKLADALGDLGEVDGWSVALAAGAIAIMLLARRVAGWLPGALIALVVSILVVDLADLTAKGVSVVGTIPTGLPLPAWPSGSWADVRELIPGALAVALVGFAAQAVDARTWATKGGDRSGPNRDLGALGAANVAGAIGGGYPVTSASARTAAGVMAGGRSPVLALVAAAVLAAVAIFAAPLLENLPSAVLGAVVALAVVKLIDVETLKHLRRQHPVELGIAVATAAAVIVLGVQQGLAVAVVISLLDVVRRASYPNDAVLGTRPGREGHFDVSRWQDATTEPGLLIYRFDAPLFFANAQRFHDRLEALVDASDPPTEWVVIDAAATTDLDATATEVIEPLLSSLRTRGITVVVARATGRLRDLLAASDLVPDDLVFKTLGEAVAAFHSRP